MIIVDKALERREAEGAPVRVGMIGAGVLGIPGIGSSATDIRDFLNDVIASADVDRVVMAGASAGGFAALLFGTWCGADKVIAFSPQTFIDRENRRQSEDDRWEQQIGDLYPAMAGRAPILDILDVLPLNDGTRTRRRFRAGCSPPGARPRSAPAQ